MSNPIDYDKLELDVMNTYLKLLRAAETVTVATHRHLAEEKMTITQFGVLETLYHLGPMCQKEVAEKNLKSNANITTVIDNLEKRVLVERRRSSEDRRYITVHLTSSGYELIKRIFPKHVQGVVQSLSVLSKEELKQLGQLCKKLGTAQKV